MLLTAMGTLLVFPQKELLLLLCIGVKFIQDYFLLETAARKFSVSYNRMWFPMIFLLYPLYICLFGILGAVKKYHWKK